MRTNLGGHDGFRSGQLHKEEVASLVIRAGRAAGFVVRTEVKAPWLGGLHTMDCGWYHPTTNELVVIWEFDGQNASRAHMTNIARKLSGCRALTKYSVLYSVRNDLTPKGRSRHATTRTILPHDVEILTDEGLMRAAPDGIDRVMSAAKQRAGLP